MTIHNSGHVAVGVINDVAGNQTNHYEHKYINTAAAKDFLRLSAATDAAWDSSARSPADICCDGTRLQALSDVIKFLEDPQNNPKIYWLYGASGLGKSTLAQSLAAQCREKDILGATFFFSQDDVNRNDARKLFTTLAYQLCRASKHQDQRSRKVLSKDPGIVDRKPSEQLQKLLLDVIPEGFLRNVVIVDAIDESGSDEILEEILPLLLIASQSTPLRFVITSQKTPSIQTFVQDNSQHLKSVDLFSYDADEDIHHFYLTRFTQLSQQRRIQSVWFSDSELIQLVASTGGLFVYAATVVKYLATGRQKSPRRRLEDVLNIDDQKFPEVYQRLDALYRQILSQIPQRDYDELTRKVIGTVCLAGHPLTPSTLDTILDLEPGDAWQCLQDLHALFRVPEEKDTKACVRLAHRFFRGFILDADRSNQYAMDIHQGHTFLSNRCLDVLVSGLKRNICDLPPSGTLSHPETQAILRDKCSEHVSGALEYASRFWCHHIRRGDSTKESIAALGRFVQGSILHWVETMSLLRRLGEAIFIFHSATPFIEASAFNTRFEDIGRTVETNFSKIEDWPLNVYHLDIAEASIPTSNHPAEEPPEPPLLPPVNSAQSSPPKHPASPAFRKQRMHSGSSPPGRLNSPAVSSPEIPSSHSPAPASPLPSELTSDHPLQIGPIYESPDYPVPICSPELRVAQSPTRTFDKFDDIRWVGHELPPSEYSPDGWEGDPSPPLSGFSFEEAAVHPACPADPLDSTPPVSDARPVAHGTRAHHIVHSAQSPSTQAPPTLPPRGPRLLKPAGEGETPTPPSRAVPARKNPPPLPPRLTTTYVPDSSHANVWCINHNPPKHFKFTSLWTEPDSATTLRDMYFPELSGEYYEELPQDKWDRGWTCSVCQRLTGDLVIYSVSGDSPSIICEGCLRGSHALRSDTFAVFHWLNRHQVGQLQYTPKLVPMYSVCDSCHARIHNGSAWMHCIGCHHTRSRDICPPCYRRQLQEAPTPCVLIRCVAPMKPSSSISTNTAGNVHLSVHSAPPPLERESSGSSSAPSTALMTPSDVSWQTSDNRGRPSLFPPFSPPSSSPSSASPWANYERSSYKGSPYLTAPAPQRYSGRPQRSP